MSYIEINDVSFEYPGGYKAINDLTLSINAGEEIAIIGENGAGKTTLARLINGLLHPTKGDVIIDGMNTKNFTTAKIASKVGYVFQNPDDQIFNKDVITEILYTPHYLKLPEDEIKRRLDRVMDLVQLKDEFYENPYDLSYSIRKFVTIGAVLAMETDVVILDEPTAGQDKIGMDKLDKIIQILNTEGRTVITITHDMEFVVRNFERTIVMANSHIIADSDKRDIFWQQDILKEAALHQPYISQLANALGTEDSPLTADEFMQCITKKSMKE
jgi:energy-coupling factor transport system ATP-binding protein